jgi:hypothetical protein
LFYNSRNKRGSGFEERLMEIKSKIELFKGDTKNMIGHGSFNFAEL